MIPIAHTVTPDLFMHVLLSHSPNDNGLYMNFLQMETLQSHGPTLRQLTSSSTTLNALLDSAWTTWSSLVDEWTEVEKVKKDVVSKLREYLAEDPSHDSMGMDEA